MNMTEREKLFFENLIIDDVDRDNMVKSLKSKGVEKHIQIKEKLLSWQDSDCIEYAKIASTYRYDKRIRNTLFKYISYLEEYYRSVILDNYISNVNQSFWNKTLSNLIQKHRGNLNDSLERLEFSVLLDQCRKLPDTVKLLCNLPTNHLNKNIHALVELRNAVMHNKFLLLYRGFEVCYVQGVDNNKSTSIKANILNLIQFLPTEVGLQCAKDINDCKKDRNADGDTQWELPAQVIISLKVN